MLIDHAARGGHHPGRIVEELCTESLNHLAAHRADRLHRLGHAEHQTDVMGVVDVQIEHRPAALLRIVKILHPHRIGNNSLKMSAQQPAVLAAGDRLIGILILGKERQNLSDRQQLAGLFRGRDHPIGVGRIQGDRLLTKHVLACPERGDGHLGVPGRRQADVDHIEVRIGQHLVEIGIPGNALEVHHLALRTEIPLDRPPIAGQPLLVLLAQRGHLHAADLLIGLIVDHPHKTDARNADVYHLLLR